MNITVADMEKRIKNLAQKNGVSLSKVYSATRIKHIAFEQMDIATIVKIAEVLDCSIDYLLFRTEVVNAHKALDTPPDQEEQDLIDRYRKLNWDGKVIVRSTAIAEIRNGMIEVKKQQMRQQPIVSLSDYRNTNNK